MDIQTTKIYNSIFFFGTVAMFACGSARTYLFFMKYVYLFITNIIVFFPIIALLWVLRVNYYFLYPIKLLFRQSFKEQLWFFIST